jgi:hypothetical protein
MYEILFDLIRLQISVLAMEKQQLVHLGILDHIRVDIVDQRIGVSMLRFLEIVTGVIQQV